MESNNNIDKLFKGVLKNFESAPDSDIWLRIEERLNDAETPSVRRNYMQYAAVMFLFLSLCLISVPLAKKSSNSTASAGIDLSLLKAESVKTSVVPEEDLFQASASEINETIKSKNNHSQDLDAFADDQVISQITAMSIGNNEEDFIFVPNDEVESSETNPNAILISRQHNLDLPLSALSADRDEENEYIVAERDIDEDHLEIKLKGMYVGVNGSYNQTSLLEYGNIYRGERPIQPSLKFGTSKGITAGYNFSNHFGIQLDYIYNAVLGQNYVSTQEEVVTEKTLALNYDQLALTAKFKQARFLDITDHPIVVNYVAGVQYGALRDYRVPQEKRWESTEDLFVDHDWALVMGLDYDIYLQDNLFISIGGRSTISTDISLHNEPLDDYAKRNFVFGIRGGLNYVFR